MFAADAVARLSGVVGVAAVTAGPGKRNNVFLILSCLSFEIQDILFQMKFSLRLEWFSMLFSNNHKSHTLLHTKWSLGALDIFKLLLLVANSKMEIAPMAGKTL